MNLLLLGRSSAEILLLGHEGAKDRLEMGLEAYFGALVPLW